MNNQQHHAPAIFRKRLLFFLLLVLPLWIQAQTDSVVLNDSLPADNRETITKDAPRLDITTTENEDGRFLKKGESAEDSFIVQRHVPDSLIKKMKQEDAFWYANAEIKEEENANTKDQESGYTPVGQRKWFQTLLWLVIIGGFGGVILWYLAGSRVGLFRKKNKAIESNDEEELSTEDIFAINYQKEIDKAEAGGNYRLAIRLMFLRLLKDMAGKNIIRYKQDKTNLDYLFQLSATVYYDHFFRICRNYEYSWYGQFEVRETAYRIIRNDFVQFNHQIH